MWAEDPDGRLFLYREIYHTQRTVDVHAKLILSIVQDHRGVWVEPRPRAIICDHDAESRAVFARDIGIGTIAANKKVTEGIQAFQMRLAPAGDGKPRLFLLRDSVFERDPALLDAKKPTCTQEEVVGYIWDRSKGQTEKEVPLKENDHGMDAARYLVADRDLGSRPRVRRM